MPKVELLKRVSGKPAGEVVEVKEKHAKLLKSIGKAKDYVEAVVRPQEPPKEEVLDLEPETETETEKPPRFGIRRPYSRRDMTPEEE